MVDRVDISGQLAPARSETEAAERFHLLIVAAHNAGIPSPPALQAPLFDPLRRGDRESRTAKTAGLGLGLYISSEIVRGHGGSSEIDSSVERGTTFRVKIPAQLIER